MISNTFGTDLLKLIFNAVAISGLADNASSGALTQLYLSLHTADPGAGGNQSTNEVNYIGYQRLAVQRGAAGFTISDVTVHPTTSLEFGEMTGGSQQTASHLCVGTHASGSGKLLFRLAMSPTVDCKNGVTPRIRETSSLTVVTS